MMKPEEYDLLMGLQQTGTGRRKYEEMLFRRYDYFIREAQKKYGFDGEDAFDMYSDSVISAIDHIADGRFEGRSSLKTWLYQIFHNKCVSLLRRKATNKNSIHRTVAIPDMFLELSDAAQSVLDKLIQEADFEKLKLKLGHLGENCRRMLALWSDGSSDREIAAVMEYKTADVVKTGRLRCLEKLRQLYHSAQ